jgi:hypothetical protein
MSEESTMFVIDGNDILTATGKGLNIELGRILSIHSRALPIPNTDPPKNEMLYTFTLDNKIQITLPHSRIFQQPVLTQIGQ